MSARITILFAASNVIKIPAYATLGQLTRDNLLVGAVLVPIAIAANYAGIWLVRRTSTELFFRIAYVLMFLIAVELMRSSITRAVVAAMTQTRCVPPCRKPGGAAARVSALIRAAGSPASPSA